jgi:hypothetical protein
MAAFSCRFLKGEVDRLLRKRAGPFSSKRAEIESLCESSRKTFLHHPKYLGHPDNISMKTTFLLASSALLAVCNADIKFSRTINTITDATADVTISGCAATDKYGKRPE